MFNFNSTDNINTIVRQGAAQRLTDKEFIEKEIQQFLNSDKRRNMIKGQQYFNGVHDILKRKRSIAVDGEEVELKNLPSNKIIDNQYKKMVRQKNNHLVGQMFTVKSEEVYTEALRLFFDECFHQLLKNVGRDSLNCGIGWIHVYYDEQGELTFRRFRPWQIIPLWADEDHTQLDAAIRIYEAIQYVGKEEKVVQKIEVYHAEGISRFILDGNVLEVDPDYPSTEPYFSIGDQGYNWAEIPLIAFKYGEEIPLLNNIKSLQDAINLIMSVFTNNMEEDTRNSIIVLINYGGEDVDGLRKKIFETGVVKVKTREGSPGDVKTLHVEVNSENYKAILEVLKKALIENAMGYDAKDDRLGANANQLNLKSMYNDIELDANDTEAEYKTSLKRLLYFINAHLVNAGIGNFENVEIKIEFNRDMLMNESELIEDINKDNTVSLITKLGVHPWVSDAHAEMQLLEEQWEKERNKNDPYKDTFKQDPDKYLDDGDKNNEDT